MGVANAPLLVYWILLGLRARNLWFFTAVNPAIETGGLFGESKIGILNQVPEDWKPTTVFVPEGQAFETVLLAVQEHQLSFPLIVKPDVGERGFLVQRVDSKEELREHLRHQSDFLIQEYIDYPLEIAVLHYREIGQKEGTITSVCVKSYLEVEGDGQSTIEELMATDPRSRFQLDRLRAKLGAELQRVLPMGEKYLLEPIGNHSRGTTFWNGNDHIDGELTAVFDRISAPLQGIQYCRFDMKCRSWEELREGKGFSILEINGVGSDPAHVYDPAYPFRQIYPDLFAHWRIIYRLARQQRAAGVQPMTTAEMLRDRRQYVQRLRRAAIKRAMP